MRVFTLLLIFALGLNGYGQTPPLPHGMPAFIWRLNAGAPQLIPNGFTVSVSLSGTNPRELFFSPEQIADLLRILEKCEAWQKTANDHDILMNWKTAGAAQARGEDRLFLGVKRWKGQLAKVVFALDNSEAHVPVYQEVSQDDFQELKEACQQAITFFQSDKIKKNSENAEKLLTP